MVELEVWLHFGYPSSNHRSSRVVKLVIGLHQGNPRVVKLEVGLHHGYLGSDYRSP